MKLAFSLCVKKRKVKTSRVPKFQKLQRNQRSKKWEKTTFTVPDLNIRMGGGLRLCDYSYDGALQKLGFFGVAPTVQGTNANHAKLEDSAQLAQVIVLVNELREALVGKGLINGSA